MTPSPFPKYKIFNKPGAGHTSTPLCLHYVGRLLLKILILAADGPDTAGGEALPRCLMPWRHGKTALDILLSGLGYCGVPNNDIFIVVGSQGVWSGHGDFASRLGSSYSVLINERNDTSTSFDSLILGLSQAKIDEDVIVLNGDLIASVGDLDRIIGLSGLDCVRVRDPLWSGEKGIPISFDSKSSALTRVGHRQWPWGLYAGALSLSKASVSDLMAFERLGSSPSVPEGVVTRTGSIFFVAKDGESLDSLRQEPWRERELIGGSFANLSARHIVRKQASGDGLEKIRDEVRWLQDLEPDLKPYFPEIEAFELTEESAWFEMPFYDIPSLRQQVLLHKIHEQEFRKTIDKILEFLVENFYSRSSPGPGTREEKTAWLDAVHFDRFFKRFGLANIRSPDLAAVTSRDVIQINGLEFPSLYSQVLKLRRNESRLEHLAPRSLSKIHGDLHFQNILVDATKKPDAFVLADPRGEMAADYHYDLGKLWHSFDGKYDLVHTDRFEISVDHSLDATARVNFSFRDPELVQIYDFLGAQVAEAVAQKNFFSSDPLWFEKTMFNQAMHFSSVSLFHLGQTQGDKRAIALHCIAVMKMHDFMSQ